MGCSRKPWVPSTCASDLRKLHSVPLRSQGHCGVGRGLSELHWVWCNGRGPHLEWRQETHVSSPDFPWARSDSDHSFAAEFEQESQASSCVEEWNSACLSSCSRGDRSLLELCVVPAGFSRRYPGVSVPLRVVPSSKGLSSKRCPGIGSYQERTGKSGSFGMCHHPRGYVSNILVRPASS